MALRARSLLFGFVCLAASLRGAPAHAQTTPPASPAPSLPEDPAVHDPMLDAPPRARIEIATWADALTHVRARSADLITATQEVLRAEAQSRVALAAFLPSLNGTGTYTHNMITATSGQVAGIGPTGPVLRRVEAPYPDYITGQLALVWPIIAPRAWHARGTAERAIDVAKLSVDEAKRTIALGVSNAIVGVITAERVAELNRNGLRNALTRLELAQRKTTLGGGTGLDVVRAKQDVEVARSTLVAGDETLRQAREALGLALALPEQVGVPPHVDLNGLEASARASCKPTNDLEERADIAAQRGRVDLARRAHNDVKWQFVPNVDLRSTLGTTTMNTGLVPRTTWNIQAVLTVPIWDGGARYGNLRDTEAQEIIALQKLEAARRQAQVQIAQADRGVTVAEERRSVAERARDLAAENDRLTRASYLEGRGTSLELVAAAQSLRDQDIQLALRDFELVKARILAVIARSVCRF